MSEAMDAAVLKMQRDSLRDALRKVLETREKEARAHASYQIALDNYGPEGRSREATHHMHSMNAASMAEREARVLLLTLRDEA